MSWAIASIVFTGGAWKWAALAGAVVLVPLALLAVRPGILRPGAMAVALALRTLAVGLILLCLLDPQLVTPRAKPGANFFAIVADDSSSLQITDAGAKASRGTQVKSALTGPEAAWLASLGIQYQLRPYAFDRDLRRVQDFTQLDFDGEGTALGAALRGLRERFTGQPLAGILLFSDGDATDLPNGLPDLSGLPPVYPIVVGSAEGLRDVRLEKVSVRETAFDDAPVTVRADIAGQGVAGRELSVSVKPLNAPPPGAGEVDAPPPPQTLHLLGDSEASQVTFDWKPRGTGMQFFDLAVNGPGLEEATLANNHKIVMVDRGRPAYRILYVAGRPNWEYKFLKRALTDDPQLNLVGIIRVAKREPKYNFIGRAGDDRNPLFGGFGTPDDTQGYDQPVIIRDNVKDDVELRSGFPKSVEELYTYDAIVIDDVEAEFFTTDQLAMMRRFVAERGGGLLALGGADTLEAGGYVNTPLANALPVYLDRKAPTIPEGQLMWRLTREGWLEPWTRVRANELDEHAILNDMPRFEVSNSLNSVKPGATVLATVTDQTNHIFPALVSQNYGAGRVAVLGLGDLWKWNFWGDTGSADLARFWRQLSRWLVTNVPQPVEMKAEKSEDAAGGVKLRVTARDRDFRPLDIGTANITVRRVATDGKPADNSFTQGNITALPVADAPGQFAATFAPRAPGAYIAEVEVTNKDGKVVGKAQAGWVNDPVAEEFQSLAPNRALLEEIARRTGGQIIPWSQLNELAETLPKRRAPITEDTTQPLWHHSSVFLAVLLCLLAEWGWRRWKGLP